MTLDALDKLLRAFNRRQPFHSYWIEFVSGDRVVVTHPEAVARFGELIVFRGPDRSQRVFDGNSVCQVLQLPS